MKLSPDKNDPFDPYTALLRTLRFWQWTAVALLGLTTLAFGWALLSWSRPPVIITRSSCLGDERAQVVQAGKPAAATVDDAKIFFWDMVRLRYEWDSLTVERDMREFRRHCLSPQRAVEDEHLAQLVPAGTDEDAEKVPRLRWWIASRVRNNLVLPQSLDEIECQEREELFHCRIQTSLVTQSMLPAGEAPRVHRMTFLGTLVRVPHRIETPYGMAVAALYELPADGRKEPG